MNRLRGILMSGTAVALLAFATSSANAGLLGLHKCCEPACCEPAPVCCEPAPVVCCPAPVEVSWCVVDPCDPCCKHEVTACVPACCAGMVPCLADWHKGFLGRKVLTYKFPGCDHCVEVVLTKHGRTIVR